MLSISSRRRWRPPAPSYYAVLRAAMAQDITEWDLRIRSGEIMRALDSGEPFVITRDVLPVGELRPVRRRTFGSADVVGAAFAGTPHIDAQGSRNDRDYGVDQTVSHG
jgi:antitoxin (DNA-binding transcriptional repressor) of toxin-antitoxin stability system